jgi:phage repressor protein C with HTH and peptisase S24 domain
MRVELAREKAGLPGGLVVTIAGISMEPVAKRGDQVVVRAGGRLRPGDVFLFETSGGELELHRLVVALPGGWLVHRGDNQVVRGFGATRRERVIGKAELARRAPGPVEVARALLWAATRAPAFAKRRR